MLNLKNKKTGHTSLQRDWSIQIDWSKKGKGIGEKQVWSKMDLVKMDLVKRRWGDQGV